MTEAASTSETSINFYRTAQCNIPEDRHLHIRRSENLKSHEIYYIYADTSKIHKQIELAGTILQRSVSKEDSL
jgi:hypothetical protein